MWTPEWKARRLREVREEWSACQRCNLCQGRNNVVFGQGDAAATVMIIGEAPGEEEDATGRPFIGPSGTLLNAMLEAAGVDRKRLYVTNVVACRPPDNRVPSKTECNHCRARLTEEIYTVDPLLLVLAGKTAISMLISAKEPMEKLIGNLYPAKIPGKAMFGGKPTPVLYDAMPIYHPSYILRNDIKDPKNGRWQKGKPAYQTLEHLKKAFNLVENLMALFAEAYKWRNNNGETSTASECHSSDPEAKVSSRGSSSEVHGVFE